MCERDGERVYMNGRGIVCEREKVCEGQRVCL